MMTIVERIEQRAKNMGAMMHRLGISPDAAYAGRQMSMAARRCSLCAHADQCQRWLATPGTDQAAWQTFCPNAVLFARLRH